MQGSSTRLGRVAALLVCSGTAMTATAQPVLDGQLDAGLYGPMIWAQNQKIIAPLKDNVTGAGGSAPTDQVTSGLELSIPLAALGIPGGFAASNPLRLTVLISGGNGGAMSNQVLGSLQQNQNNFGSIRTVNLETIPGGDPVSFTPTSNNAGTTNTLNNLTAIIDGQRAGTLGNAGANPYGTVRAQQTNFTGYGDATHANCSFGAGSELDAIYGYVVNNTIAGSPTAGRTLFLFVAGNLETNGNGIEIFFDTVPNAGQNRLLFGNATGGHLQNMSESAAGAGDGLTFAAGFAPDYWIGVNAANGDNTVTPPVQPTLYVDYSTLPTDPVATVPTSAFVGQALMCQTGIPNADQGLLTGGTLSAGGALPPEIANIRAALNNSNILGVAGSPPGGQAPNVDSAFGSELDNVYATVDTATQTLYLFIGGNLQSDFSKLTLWFDAAAAPSPFDPPPGQNRVLGSNVDISFNGLNRFGDDGTGNGLTFDADFAATFWMGVNIGGNPPTMYIDSATVRNGGRLLIPFFGGALDYGSYSGATRTGTIPGNPVGYPSSNEAPGRLDGQDGTKGGLYANYAPRHLGDQLAALPLSTWPTPADAPIVPTATAGRIRANLDNRNVAGITTASAAGAAAVTSGVEIAVSLSELGWDGTSCIKLVGLLAQGGDYGLVSNQIIGDLPADSANLGNPRAINFSTIPGNQYVTLWCPTPVACAADYNRDSFLNLDDLGDFITDFYTVPAIPGGLQPNAPTYSDVATVGYGTACQFAADAPAPYQTNAYRANGYRVGYSSDGSNSCPFDPSQPFPNLDNLNDYITFYYGTFGQPGTGCN